MKQRANTLIAVIAVALLISVAAFPHLRHVVQAQPGDANDPLVTRRYVDERFDALWAEVQLLRGMADGGYFSGGTQHQPWDLQAIAATIFQDVMHHLEAGGSHALGWTAINPQNGQTLIMENGTEVIVRAGTTVVVAGANGLVNATSGSDLVNGQTVPTNNLLIAPATDGRGVRVTSTNAWIMVRGAFTLQ
ncbi:MAG: hypothetical protein FWC16_09165 [Defluviitaleaceae bacterium]|nr:hypothetical protein [Defluviitaleaceae bacterium]MCL2275080.1 hypothetical protein [Defluviitaleaceae bacterium]